VKPTKPEPKKSGTRKVLVQRRRAVTCKPGERSALEELDEQNSSLVFHSEPFIEETRGSGDE
jgi:hypothetical protein